jgi:hypothetical protein
VLFGQHRPCSRMTSLSLAVRTARVSFSAWFGLTGLSSSRLRMKCATILPEKANQIGLRLRLFERILSR